MLISMLHTNPHSFPKSMQRSITKIAQAMVQQAMVFAVTYLARGNVISAPYQAHTFSCKQSDSRTEPKQPNSI